VKHPDAAVVKRTDPRNLGRQLCMRPASGDWQHYTRKTGEEPYKYAGPCRNFDHDGHEPWTPWPDCEAPT